MQASRSALVFTKPATPAAWTEAAISRRRSSFGFFGLFGRSFDMRMLDAALKGADLHPLLVPEGVKMTIVNLMKDHGIDEIEEAYPAVGDLFACLVTGADAFASVNGTPRLNAVEARIEAALEKGEGLDAQLVLLALHSNLIRPEIVERYAIEAGD